MSRLSFTSLSLVHPDLLEQPSSPRSPPPTYVAHVSYSPRSPPPAYVAHVSYSPRSPPPAYVAHVSYSPHSPPPAYVAQVSYSPRSPPPPLRLARAPRKCSGCRQIGHTIRNCPGNDGAREALFDDIIDRIVRRVPNLLSYPEIFGTAMDDIHRYIRSLSIREVRQGSRPGSVVICNCYTLISDVLTTIEDISRARPRPLLGKHHAKQISILVTNEEKREEIECFICCDRVCSIKASCGHEFCGECVMSIIDTGKNKTSAPQCSFCCAPFSKFTAYDRITYEALGNFIENM
jgi:hypothetical protein